MYIPAHFRENDLAIMQALMREYSFATLVSTTDEGVPIATPLPLLLESEPAPYGTLKAHMALGNPQWRTFRQDRDVLVLFQGPHAYISPSWYEEALSVPTWNYATVHAYGIPRIMEDPTELYAFLKVLIQTHEAQFADPWPFEQVPGEYVEKMIQGVVGFSIEITRLEGKWKLSQNRTPRERARIAEELCKSQDPSRAGVAELVSGVRKRIADEAPR